MALALVSCAEKYTGWNVTVENGLNAARTDEAFLLSRAQLQPSGDGMLPAVKDAAGNWVASQVDDLDGDGKWDELAFVADLEANGKAVFNVVWVAPAEYPSFKVRTNVRYGVMTSPGKIEELKRDTHTKELAFEVNKPGYPYQMDGVAWENDKVGFRHYYDGRNARDYFGKRTPEMVLDSVGIRRNGTPGDTYHVWADWGRDILSVGVTFGLGGLGGWVDGERFARLGRLAQDPADIIDSTRYTLIAEGPVRSRFAFEYFGWEIEGNKVDYIRNEVTLWAGKHNYENSIFAPNLPSNVKLITGLPRINNDMPLDTLKFNNYTAMATHDYQSYNKEFIMGMAIMVPNSNLARIFDTPEEGAPLIKQWCAELRLDDKSQANFMAYGAWEHQDTLFRDRNYFMDLIKAEGARLDNPVKVTLEAAK